MLKSYKFKLLPTEDQIVLLEKHFGSVRFVYNHFLNKRKFEYELNKQSLTFYDDSKELTKLKKQDEYKWLNEINSQSLQYSLKCLDGAYNSFFKKRSGFPKFRSKKSIQSYTSPQTVKIDGDLLKITKFREGIKFKKHRKFFGNVKQCTISKDFTNSYFVSILIDTNHNPLPNTNKEVGIDLGIKDLVITSDGNKYKNNKYTKKYERNLKKHQKHLSRKKKGSNRYKKQKIKIAKIHKKITNSRKDRLHKISSDLIKKYDEIYIEDLDVKKMIGNKQISKQIQDSAWSTFVFMLEYKSNWNNKKITKIDRYFPSSKTCNCCGFINQDLNLSIREWKCPSCNSILDRDINASKNILQEGIKISSSGLDDYNRGGKIRPDGTSGETIKTDCVLQSTQ
jgi:putative transposase